MVAEGHTKRSEQGEHARDQLRASLVRNDLGGADTAARSREGRRNDESVVGNLQARAECLDEQSRPERYPEQDRQPPASPRTGFAGL